MHRPHTLTAFAAALSLAALTACGGNSSGASDSGVTIVATTGPLGSITEQITSCAGGDSSTLMGPGDDPHTFSLSSEQLTDVVGADLIVANGLGLEETLSDALSNAEAEGAVVYEVAPELDPIAVGETADAHAAHAHEGEHGHEHGGEHGHAGHDHGSEDPHVWLDAGRMASASRNIGQRIADETGDRAYVRCGNKVAADLEATDRRVRTILESIPADRRVMITDHDAFGYFAQAYDFEVVGTVVPGGSTEASASSSHIAELAELISAEGVTTIFSNQVVPSSTLDNLASASGTEVTVVPLLVGSLGDEGSGAETYQSMMVSNARAVAQALGK